MLKISKKPTHNFNCKRFWCVFLALAILSISSISLVSAWDFDNGLDYEKDDMVVVIENAWGLPLIGEVLGKAELKSHKNVNEERYVIPGKDRVVMYYEFTNWGEVYRDGLGEVEFIDMRDGETITRDYHFARAIYEEKVHNVYEEQCELRDVEGKGVINVCRNVIVGTDVKQEIVGWERLETNDIPQTGSEMVTIGLVTNVRHNDYIDGIWTIAGKKISRHAVWTASLNVNLVVYYNFENETASSTNLVENVQGVYNGTLQNTNSSNWVAGRVGNNSLQINNFSANQWVDIDGINDTQTANYTFNMWARGGEPSDVADIYLFDSEVGRLVLEWYTSSPNEIGWFSGATDSAVADTPDSNTWQMLTFVFNDTNGVLYINGTRVGQGAYTPVNLSDGAGDIALMQKYDGDNARSYNGTMDELGIWNRTLTASEITDLYNDGNGLTYDPDPTEGPTVDLNNPADSQTFTLVNVSFDCNASDNVEVANMSLYIDGAINTTVTGNSTTTAGLTTDLNFNDGSYEWTCGAFDDEANVGFASANRTFVINTTPAATFETPTPADFTNLTVPFFDVNASTTETYFRNQTFLVYSSGGVLYSQRTHTNSTRNVNYTNVPDGDYNISVEFCTTTHQCNVTNRTLSIDLTPAISLVDPTPTSFTNTSGSNITMNVTLTEGFFQNLTFFIYDSTGLFDSRTHTNSTRIASFQNIAAGDYNISAQTCTTTSSCNSTENRSITIFDFRENSQTFNPTTIEGSTETFTINFTFASDRFTNLVGNLVYNNTNYTGTLSQDGDEAEFTASVAIPNVIAETNLSFNWSIALINGTYNFFTSTLQSQVISNVSIDDCSSFGTLLINMTLFDEEDQTLLNNLTDNSTVEIDLQLDTSDGTSQVVNFSTNFTDDNNPQVCLEVDLNDSNYLMDVQIRYAARDYAEELYHIIDFNLSNSSLPQNINLYDLLSTDATQFLITFKNEDFLAVSDALINIQRKYISDGVFRTVEIPQTDENGQAVGHFDTESVIYTIIVTKDGEVLGTFNNVAVVCQSQVIETCELNLNALGTSSGFTEYETSGDLSRVWTFSPSAREIENVFVTTDGSTATVNLTSLRYDRFGNETVCSDQLISSGGTLTCTIPDSFGNVTVITTLSKDGTTLETRTFTISQDARDYFGQDVAVFLIIMLITIPLMLVSSLIGVVFGVSIGFIMSIGLMISTQASILGTTSSLIWLMLAGGIIIWKISKR